MGSSSPTIASHDSLPSQLEFKWKEVMSALGNLPLKYVTFHDYIFVMRDQIDATIDGEPHLGLQLWFSLNTGKVISRIWGQTVACQKVANVSQFVEVCTEHFQGRPCIGYPDGGDTSAGTWLPDGYSQNIRSYVFGSSGFWTMAPLSYAAKFDSFLSLDCARVEGVGAQSKERKGSNFAA